MDSGAVGRVAGGLVRAAVAGGLTVVVGARAAAGEAVGAAAREGVVGGHVGGCGWVLVLGGCVS